MRERERERNREQKRERKRGQVQPDRTKNLRFVVSALPWVLISGITWHLALTSLHVS